MKRHLRRGPAPIFPALRFALALVGIALWQIGGAASLAAQEAAKTNLNPQDGLTYVWIGPGNFVMGCSKGDDNCLDDEDPAHTVTITKGFWIGQTPVTQAAYRKVMNTNPSSFHGDQLPVDSVTWDEAESYCKSIDMRLPTEAEYEYATRAGTAGRRYAALDSIAWYMDNSGGTTHNVAQKQPNPAGLYDMLGNVTEWVSDWFEPWYDGMTVVDPVGAVRGQWKMVRGGSWNNDRSDIRASMRSAYSPEMRSNEFGFRCASN